MLHVLFAAALAVPFAASAQETWQFLATESDILAATGDSDIDLLFLATDGAGLVAAVDIEDPSRIVLVDTTGSPPAVSVLATEADLVAAINAANGTSPALANSAIRDIAFLGSSHLLAYTRELSTPSDGNLSAISIAPPRTIFVLSTSVDGGAFPIPGGEALLPIGDRIFVLQNAFRGAPGDQIVEVDASTLVGDGSLAPALVVSESQIVAAAGQPASEIFLSDAIALDADTFVVVNGPFFDSNSNLLLVELTPTPTASLYVEASGVASELGAADVAFDGIARDTRGALYLPNAMGSGTGQRGVVRLENVAPPAAEASVILESGILADLGTAGMTGWAVRGIVYDPVGDQIVLSSNSAGVEGLVRLIVAPPAAIAGWEGYE